jgi:hypothetical protein
MALSPCRVKKPIECAAKAHISGATGKNLMIRYDLVCDQDHRFDGWFQSATGFDGLKVAGHLSCAICGSGRVEKTLMAPAVSLSKTVTLPTPVATAPEITTPRNDAERALAALRAKVEAGSDYVGMNFATEARAIHSGDAPERPIYGEAKFEEAKALIEDGIPVAPLPFIPTRKAN